MATDHIRYDVLARDALRGVLRRVLTDAAEHGLPGEHHFFITFLSTAEGVKLSPRLLAQYPEEMTVILQHQFWDLTVLRIASKSACRSAAFPSGWWCRSIRSRASSTRRCSSACNSKPSDAATEDAGGRQAARRTRAAPVPTALTVPEPAAESRDEPAKPSEGAEVVRLDRFRKK